MRAQPERLQPRAVAAASPTWACSACLSPKPTADLGGGPVDVMLVMEAFGRALVLEPYLATVVLAGGCLRDAGSATQQRERMAARDRTSGETTYAFAHVERGARYDLAT